MRQGQLGMRNSYTHLISSYLIFLMDVIYLGIDKARKLFIPIFYILVISKAFLIFINEVQTLIVLNDFSKKFPRCS